MPSQGNQHRQTLVLCAAAVGVGLLVTAAANATPVQQPDGTDIPKPPDRTDRPNEPSMQQVLDTAEGAGQIDVTTMVDSEYPPTNSAALNDVDVDAAATPQTFKPQCDLTFEVFSRGADSRNSFGWYNVTGSATEPTTSELIEMIGCSDPVGFTSGPVNFAEHPRWTGGDIGFYIASQVMENGGWDSSCPTPSVHGSLFFSESKYNRGVDGTTDYKYVLIVDSKITPDSFYFGWEDSVYNADWDFNDLLVRVTGIQCKGAGETCDTELFGRCAPGITSCENGEVVCKQLMPAQAETCNAVDDDCNGFVDEGDLCDAGKVCDAGVCKPSCAGGEFQCEDGNAVCDDATGLCVDADCLGVVCEAGKVCDSGDCKEACDGVACPHGKICQLGLCVDPCQGIVCDTGYVCQGGACVVGCQCDKCDDGYTCDDVATFMCLEDDCANIQCATGEHCVAGVCENDCESAICPEGSECQAGDCVPTATGGGGGGGGGAGGEGAVDIGGSAGDSSATAGTGAVGAGATTGATTPYDPIDTPSGCSCEVPSGTRSGDAGWLALGLVGLLGAGIRRRRS